MSAHAVVVDGAHLHSVASADVGLQVTAVLETSWEGHVHVGSSRERRGFDVSVDDDVSTAMLDRAARLMPALAGLQRDSAWAALRPGSRTGCRRSGRPRPPTASGSQPATRARASRSAR